MAAEYKLLSIVGRGMTSQVYRAKDPSGKTVAIKELLVEHRRDPKRLKGFEHEAEFLRTYRHPYVLSLIEFDKARHRLILEFMPRSLRHVIVKEPFHYLKRVRWSMQIADALQHLHERGLIHKDLKPENIYLTEDGHAKIGDFGFAERAPGPMERLLSRFRKRNIQGTIAYLSPEQIKQRALSAKTDIFSLGVILYELFGGKRPFRSAHEQVTALDADDGSSLEIINQILRAEPKPLREMNGEIDKDLEGLVLSCLAKRPTGRPSALAVKATLQKILGKFA